MENIKNKFNLKNVFSILLAIICIILIVFVIFFKVNNFKILSVQSQSMSPTINVGDVLLIKPAKQYNVGDVVAYNLGGSIITHRIVEVKDDNIYICVGDNAKNKQIVKFNAILGKMCFVFNKNFKILFNFSKIIVLILFVLLMHLLKIKATR